MIEIEKNIPIPSPDERSSKYPFRKMEIGDSVFIPDFVAQSQVSGSLKAASPKKFIARKDIKEGVKGLRVWRVE